MSVEEVNEILDTVRQGYGARLEFSESTVLLVPEGGEVIARVITDGDSWDLDEDDAQSLLWGTSESPNLSWRDPSSEPLD